MKSNCVTYAKGIAIMLMVLAHSGLPSSFVFKWIYMFHMPLFFIMSGYCFKESYLTDGVTFLKRRFSGLYWPFVKWSVLFILLHNLFCYFNIYSSASTFGGVEWDMLYSYKLIIKKIITSILFFTSEQLLGGYWFLKELLLGSIIFYIFVKMTHHKWFWGVGLFLMEILFLWFNFHFPYISISGTTILATVFIWSGYLIKQTNMLFYKSNIFLLFGLISVTLGSLYWPADCFSVDVIRFIPFVLTAIIGSLSVLSLCERLGKYENMILKFLRYIGDNTLTILTWHFLSFKLVSFCIICVNDLPIYQLGAFPIIGDYATRGWFVIYFVAGILLPLGLASLNRFIPSKWLKL